MLTLLNVMEALPTVVALVESNATEGLALVSVTLTGEGGVTCKARLPLALRFAPSEEAAGRLSVTFGAETVMVPDR